MERPALVADCAQQKDETAKRQATRVVFMEYAHFSWVSVLIHTLMTAAFEISRTELICA